MVLRLRPPTPRTAMFPNSTRRIKRVFLFANNVRRASGLVIPTRLSNSRRVLRRVTYPINVLYSRFYSTPDDGGDLPGPTGPRRPLQRRLVDAWKSTPTIWYPLPLSVGILLLGAMQWRKRKQREEDNVDIVGAGTDGAPIRMKGPWQVHVLGALPLRNLSRLWGYLNSLELPIWFRPYGFKLYAYIFGCNLHEMDPPELTYYKSLGDFFYRKLKPGVRPIAETVLVSPADGTILHFGIITHSNKVEQVKGLTYSLESLLGSLSPTGKSPQPLQVEFEARDPEDAAVDDREFANVNGIEYSLDLLLGRHREEMRVEEGEDEAGGDQSVLNGSGAPDASLSEETSATMAVANDMGTAAPPPPFNRSTSLSNVKEGNQLHFLVVYLAPGDYHRFHSPTAWVVEKRRHFAGELFSVSPYLARRVANLFVLNERVALLGRWKHGFFSMVPVGATNVGSIRLNFDASLRTNLRPRPKPGTFSEATYSAASSLLRGQPLVSGQEMGGFRLGSTVVLVFEAPKEGWTWGEGVRVGGKVRVGEALGDVVGP